MPSVSRLLFVFIISLITGCANLPGKLEAPQIALENIKLTKSSALSPRFLLKLRLTNPNGISLPITGMSYSISLNSFDLIRGVSNKIDAIPAYSDSLLELEVGADVISMARFLTSLARKPSESLNYELNAKIDLQGMLPTMNVAETGSVPLQR